MIWIFLDSSGLSLSQESNLMCSNCQHDWLINKFLLTSHSKGYVYNNSDPWERNLIHGWNIERGIDVNINKGKLQFMYYIRVLWCNQKNQDNWKIKTLATYFLKPVEYPKIHCINPIQFNRKNNKYEAVQNQIKKFVKFFWCLSYQYINGPWKYLRSMILRFCMWLVYDWCMFQLQKWPNSHKCDWKYLLDFCILVCTQFMTKNSVW